ncbi:MAG: CHASE3 domain-containing protein [Alphaproteobacteria bacterium]
MPSRVLFAVLVLLMLGAAVVLLENITAERRARAQAEKTAQVMIALSAAMRAGLDAETGQRGYLLTDDETYLEPYESGSAEWLAQMRRVGELIADVATSSQRERLLRMHELAEARLAEMDRIIQLALGGERA